MAPNKNGSAASQRAETQALAELNQRSAALGQWNVGNDNRNDHRVADYLQMDAALGLAAPLLACKVAHSVRLSCKTLYCMPALGNRCTFAARVAEHSGNGLAANDRDISFGEPDEFSPSPPHSPYSVGFSIDSDGHWNPHRESGTFDSWSDYD